MRWPVVLTPEPDELLSSYLVRTVHLSGTTVHRFVKCYLNGLPLWMRDVDRSASPLLLQQIAEGTGLTIAQVEALTLRRWEGALRMPGCGGGLQSGIAPWLLVVGVYHRIRRSFGLQVCPRCLGEQVYYRRAWRLACLTCCPVHRCLLIDRCPGCSAAIVPHRQYPRRPACHRCGLLLSRLGVVPMLCEDGQSGAGDVISRLFQVGMDRGTVPIGREDVPLVDAATGIRVLVGLWQNRVGNALLRDTIEHQDPRHHLQLEQASVAGRRKAMAFLGRTLVDWPSGFLQIAESWGITQRRVDRRRFIPPWLASGIALLSPGVTWSLPVTRHVARRRAESRRSVRWQLRHAKRIQEASWRVQRANLLLRAARRGR